MQVRRITEMKEMVMKQIRVKMKTVSKVCKKK